VKPTLLDQSSIIPPYGAFFNNGTSIDPLKINFKQGKVGLKVSSTQTTVTLDGGSLVQPVNALPNVGPCLSSTQISLDTNGGSVAKTANVLPNVGPCFSLTQPTMVSDSGSVTNTGNVLSDIGPSLSSTQITLAPNGASVAKLNETTDASSALDGKSFDFIYNSKVTANRVSEDAEIIKILEDSLKEFAEEEAELRRLNSLSK
jgi:hypothetical protein